ncbi:MULTISPECIES: hypothetical protein [unclassified Rhizobacter]|uniref:hypothetical protein n=1 Tax=unclassified Rhizobacter TaxID=2640088 RepID=UPI000A88548B|nr:MULTISPECIES: hypothetical protein [unclassified Rhizobacter]
MNANSLELLQAAVEKHFDGLASERRSFGLPLFTLEHNLSKNQLRDVANGLRKSLEFGGRFSSLWLLWVVYATELGYDYDGEEYWQSFERRTPHWTQDVNRRRFLRSFFERFKSKFGASTPTGSWARQFSIIAWPITQAILPRDLQSQMARALFDSRYEIAEATNQPAAQLGSLVARHADGASARFRNFLEHEELVGLIARALLVPEAEEADTVLLPSTLARIVSDLEASWDAKAWLKEARAVARDVRIRLNFKRSEDAKREQLDRKKAEEAAEALCVVPTVSLRRSKGGSWEGFVEVPSFSGWARHNPNIDGFIRRTRCKIRGAEDVWQTRRWLLFGAQQKRLLDWPAEGTSWIRFEEREEGTVQLIDEKCRVASKPWLFRVAEDGDAYQAKWGNVRPGCTYIVVHSGEFTASEILVPVAVDVKGGTAHLLNVPIQATADSTRCLHELGLSATRGLLVWSAGLPALGLGNADVLEWSARLPLMLGIEHDETCNGFSVSIDGRGTTFSINGRKVSFVELEKLPPGLHHVAIAATFRSADGTSKLRTQASQRSFSLAVRTPVSGYASRRHAPVLVVAADPDGASLDSMMSGLATCTVHGPQGRTVDFRLELLNGSGAVIHSEELGQLGLPVDRAAWRQLVNIRHDVTDAVGEAYFKACEGRLVIDGHELGKATISLRHSVSPIRWQVSRSSKLVRLNLVDDTDHTDPVRAYHAPFVQPSRRLSSWEGPQADCIHVEGDGGLYVVAANGHRSAIIVNAPPATMSLADWQHSAPMLAPHLSNAQQVVELLYWIRDWTDARLIGPLAEHRKKKVLREMHRQLYATMCGDWWARSELAFIDSGGQQSVRESLEAAVWHNPSFAIGLVRQAEAVVTSSIQETCNHLLDHVGPYSICNDRALCELALRLAMAPCGFVDWAGEDACPRIDAIVNQKPLVKSARLLALVLGSRGQLLARDWV